MTRLHPIPFQPALLRLLVLASALGLAACGRDEPGAGATQVAATVNGEEITVHQINHVLKSSRGVTEANVDQVKREILDRLVQRELLVQHAVAQGLDHDANVLQDLDAARRDVLARAAMGREAEAAPKPDGAAVRAFYREHPELFAQRRLYRFDEVRLNRMPDDGGVLLGELERAGDLRQAVARIRKSGGDVAIVANVLRPTEHVPAELRERVREARVGTLLRYPTRDGLMLAELREVIDAPLNEEQATPAIEQILSIRARQEQMASATTRLQEAATVAYLGSYQRTPDTAAPAAAGAAPGAAGPGAGVGAGTGAAEAAAEAAASAASAEGADGGLSQGIRGLR